jgi:hypothetical protein
MMMEYGQAVPLGPGEDPYWGDVRISLPWLRCLIETLEEQPGPARDIGLASFAKSARQAYPALSLQEA